ncbi:MAG: DNA mismatch repair protein MutS [Promethearchaeota archaeon]
MTKAKNLKKITPMQVQWTTFRAMYSEDEYILAFRMGDFYEFFDADAKKVAKILDITCTTRQGRPLAGFPYASGHENLEKIVKTGISVVVADQVESPAEAKARGSKVVRRDIVRVITPGTILDDAVLDRETNNYMTSLFLARSKKDKVVVKIAMAFCDLSTGEFFTTEFVDRLPRFATLHMMLTKFNPVEVILPESLKDDGIKEFILATLPGTCIRSRDDLDFDPDDAAEFLKGHFKVSNFEGFGIEEGSMSIASAGGLLKFLKENQKSLLSNINSSYTYTNASYMQLDYHTVRNLELLRNSSDGSTRGTLFGLFSKTCTTMGSRLVKKVLLSPLLDIHLINERLDVVEYLRQNIMALEGLSDEISGICDVERLISRINYSNTINARHLLQLARSLQKIPAVKAILDGIPLDYVRNRIPKLHALQDLTGKILDTIVEDPPPRVSEGRMIRPGINPDLDDLRAIKRSGNTWLEKFQEEMREKHGISTMKVKYNKVFGYFIEVSKGFIDKVPDSWVRKQTLVNAERYINDELKVMEEKILNADERIIEIERDIFNKLREEVITHTGAIQETAKALSELDLVITFATVAASNNYCRPVLNVSGEILIKDGRHPTIETIIGRDKFISNDTVIKPDDNVLNIVTGPNMSGKSTFLRQICLISLLAQVGSFVPASSANLCIIDKMFSRVGASDDLSRSRSTFLVEMIETAYILNHATSRSLVILDELGRGTSTFDGVSLAWAVAEYLHAKKVKTLFATHYHQLSDLESYLPAVKNLNVLVSEDEVTKDLIFLHKVEEGSCDKSYGIQVARLAGLPRTVLSRADEILDRLTNDDPLTTDKIREISQNGITSRQIHPRRRKIPKQLTLFAPGAPVIDPAVEKMKELKEEINQLDINQITPLEGLTILKKLKDNLNS